MFLIIFYSIPFVVIYYGISNNGLDDPYSTFATANWEKNIVNYYREIQHELLVPIFHSSIIELYTHMPNTALWWG